MTALAKARAKSFERWTHHLFPLAVGNKAFAGGIAGVDLSTGKVEPGHVENDLFIFGTFDEDVDATTVEKPVNVDFGMEIQVELLANDGTITALMLGQLAYAVDDQTVGASGTGTSVVGRIWEVKTNGLVAVQLLLSR
jgi:hypothetical protein